MWEFIRYLYVKTDWNAITSIATIAALIAAFWALRQTRKAMEMQIFESIFKDIRDLESSYYEKYSGQPEEKKKQWATLFFNTLEYFAFLLNRKMLPQKKLIEFYGPAFLNWNVMFLSYTSKEQKDDPEAYPEFKRLIKRLEMKNGHPVFVQMT